MNKSKNSVGQLLKFVAVIGIVATVQSCYYDKAETLYTPPPPQEICSTVPAKFGANVLPLITSKCAVSGCHDATASGGLVFMNYEQISAAKDRINQRAIIEKSMPVAGPLPPAEINMLKCWIENGALNN